MFNYRIAKVTIDNACHSQDLYMDRAGKFLARRLFQDGDSQDEGKEPEQKGGKVAEILALVDKPEKMKPNVKAKIDLQIQSSQSE